VTFLSVTIFNIQITIPIVYVFSQGQLIVGSNFSEAILNSDLP